MNDLYTIPKDCYSRMEAIKIFDQVKCYGDIELGYINRDGKEIVVWICKNKQQTMFLPILKESNTLPYEANTRYTSIEEESAFIFNNKFYYFSENEQLLRVDLLFDAELARIALEETQEVYVDTSELNLCKAINLLTGRYYICWITYVQEDNLTPYTFSAFLNMPDNLPAENEPYAIQKLNIGETFEQQGYLWQVEEGEYGIQMTRICLAAYHGKTS